jgi:hypothetical protein
MAQDLISSALERKGTLEIDKEAFAKKMQLTVEQV